MALTKASREINKNKLKMGKIGNYYACKKSKVWLQKSKVMIACGLTLTVTETKMYS